jgi:hypothetical protein
VNCRSTKREL